VFVRILISVSRHPSGIDQDGTPRQSVDCLRAASGSSGSAGGDRSYHGSFGHGPIEAMDGVAIAHEQVTEEDLSRPAPTDEQVLEFTGRGLAHELLCPPSMPRPHLAPEAPIPLVDRGNRVLQNLGERIRRTTRKEVERSWALLLAQLHRLTRFTAQEVIRTGAPSPAALLHELSALENRLRDVAGSSVELLACQMTCVELLRRGRRWSNAARTRRAASCLDRVRADARMLFEWARADLWSAVGQAAVLEASRSARSTGEHPVWIARIRKKLAETSWSAGTCTSIEAIAEQFALAQLERLLGRVEPSRGAGVRRAEPQRLASGAWEPARVA
jgi:hypothetical protein